MGTSVNLHTDTHTGATHYNLIAKQPWTGKISLNDKSRKIKKKKKKDWRTKYDWEEKEKEAREDSTMLHRAAYYTSKRPHTMPCTHTYSWQNDYLPN